MGMAMSRRPAPPLFLPDEVIYEILLKLPVTSLLRFKCVCKSWKNLISDPQFVTDHLHTTTIMLRHQRLASFVNDGLREIVTCSVQSLLENPSTPLAAITSFQMDRKYSIIGSINGLLCLLESTGGCFRLWNPSTRFESKTSPPNRCPTNGTLIGFGYDQVNNKYKVVVNAYDNSLNVRITKVHTFGTDSWVTLDDSRTRIKNFPMTQYLEVGKFVSGSLNWLIRSKILSFDMENETYGEVPLPPSQPCPGGGDYSFNFYGLDILKNCLCVRDYTHRGDYGVVWLMKKYGVKESWTKLVVLPFHPLCILENGLVLTRYAHMLLLYNPNNGKSHDIDILGRFGKYIQVYQESLVSP